MTYATVMVSLALDQPNEARLEAAGEIAEQFDAGIVGIAASQFSPPLYFTSGEQAQSLIDQGRASIKKRIGELEVQFREAMKNRARHVEWRCAIDFPARYILREARCADIIVSGRRQGGVFGSARAGQPEGSGDAGGPAAADRPRCRQLDRLAKRSGGVEGHRRRRGGRSPIRCPCSARPRHITVAEILEEDGSRSARLVAGAGCRGVAVTSRCFRRQNSCLRRTGTGMRPNSWTQ